MSLTETIKKVCEQVCDDELTRLRLEEEILITMIKSQRQSLQSKSEALSRIKAINKLQLKVLGE
jgi:hypothetical protein